MIPFVPIIYVVGWVVYFRYTSGKLAYAHALADGSPNWNGAILPAFFGAFVWPLVVPIALGVALGHHSFGITSQTEKRGIHAHEEKVLDKLLEGDDES